MRGPCVTLGAVAPALLLLARGSKPTPPDPAVPVEKLKSPDQAVNGPAALELIDLGEPAVPALVDLLRDPDPSHRALSLAWIAPYAREDTP